MTRIDISRSSEITSILVGFSHVTYSGQPETDDSVGTVKRGLQNLAFLYCLFLRHPPSFAKTMEYSHQQYFFHTTICMGSGK